MLAARRSSTLPIYGYLPAAGLAPAAACCVPCFYPDSICRALRSDTRTFGRNGPLVGSAVAFCLACRFAAAGWFILPACFTLCLPLACCCCCARTHLCHTDAMPSQPALLPFKLISSWVPPSLFPIHTYHYLASLLPASIYLPASLP